MIHRIKALALLLMIISLLDLLGCKSINDARKGMMLDQWLTSTLKKEPIFHNRIKNIQVWKSGKKYHYFHNKSLITIDEGQLMQKRLRMQHNH